MKKSLKCVVIAISMAWITMGVAKADWWCYVSALVPCHDASPGVYEPCDGRYGKTRALKNKQTEGDVWSCVFVINQAGYESCGDEFDTTCDWDQIDESCLPTDLPFITHHHATTGSYAGGDSCHAW
jgi:hypothetical protein